eukprot:32919-Rhodomonas_salina.1
MSTGGGTWRQHLFDYKLVHLVPSYSHRSVPRPSIPKSVLRGTIIKLRQYCMVLSPHAGLVLSPDAVPVLLPIRHVSTGAGAGFVPGRHPLIRSRPGIVVQDVSTRHLLPRA